MPQYNFLCRACKKEFSRILTLSEHEKGGIVCPHCKSKDVEQRWAAYYAVTSKKHGSSGVLGNLYSPIETGKSSEYDVKYPPGQ